MLHNGESVRDIVLSGRFASIGLYDPPTLEDEERADKLIGFFGLSFLRDRPIKTLSNGEQRKTIIARALMPEPELLLLDEPCSGLDPKAREELLESVQKMCEMPGGPTLIYITHHIEEIVPAITHNSSSLSFYIPRMQSTLFLSGIFPPPAPFALMLAREYGFCTWFTADADKSFLMQLIIRDVILPDVIPYLL